MTTELTAKAIPTIPKSMTLLRSSENPIRTTEACKRYLANLAVIDLRGLPSVLDKIIPLAKAIAELERGEGVRNKQKAQDIKLL